MASFHLNPGCLWAQLACLLISEITSLASTARPPLKEKDRKENCSLVTTIAFSFAPWCAKCASSAKSVMRNPLMSSKKHCQGPLPPSGCEITVLMAWPHAALFQNVLILCPMRRRQDWRGQSISTLSTHYQKHVAMTTGLNTQLLCARGQLAGSPRQSVMTHSHFNRGQEKQVETVDLF